MVDELACPVCGHVNGPTANFCSSCGADLRALREERTASHPVANVADEEPAELADLPAGGPPVLVVLQGPKQGSRFALDPTRVVRAGRHPESDIFLDDITVSRRHAEVLHRDGAGFFVRDVGSLNGTYLNKERIDNEAPLTSGDELQVGKFKLVFVDRGE